MALTLYLDASTAPFPEAPSPVEQGHPAAVAFRRLGGTGPLFVRSPIPMARGLGFSGAARVAGAVAACAGRDGGFTNGSDAADEVLRVTSELEGHADNVAASLLGGVVVAAGDRALRVPLGVAPAVVAWVPHTTTRTDESRGRLPGSVSLADAAFNIGRAALLVAALVSGDVPALRTATEDRLHQDARLAAAPASRQAIVAALDAGAWCAWLSGSGPTIVALCADGDGADVGAALTGAGVVKHLRIADGATVGTN
jgi:homoserine kinase